MFAHSELTGTNTISDFKTNKLDRARSPVTVRLSHVQCDCDRYYGWPRVLNVPLEESQ
jgi:hypothetical protein